MKNLVVNAFGDLVERTDYGNHKNQLNLFDNLNEIVEENITADDILDFLFGSNRKGDNMKNMVVNAFGDLVERTDYGNHKNQLNLFDNLNEVVEENITTDDILDFLFNRKKGVK